MFHLTPRRWFWLLNAVALLCLVLSARQPRVIRRPQAVATHVVQAVVAPVAAAFYLVQSSFDHLLHDTGNGGAQLAAVRRRYENQIALLTTRLLTLEHVIHDANLIHRNFPGLSQTRIWIANITGYSTAGVDECTVDQGWRDDRRIRPGDAVLHQLAVVGRLTSVGPETSTVRLLTDPSMKENVWIVRLPGSAASAPGSPRDEGSPDLQVHPGSAFTVIANEALVEGSGAGAMNCQLDGAIDSSPPQPGDLVLLHDNEWPAAVNGAVIGRVTSVKPSPRTSLRWHLRIQPREDVQQTHQVVIVLARRK